MLAISLWIRSGDFEISARAIWENGGGVGGWSLSDFRLLSDGLSFLGVGVEGSDDMDDTLDDDEWRWTVCK